MMKEKDERLIYETPEIQIIEFELEDSIASSGEFGSGTYCSEELY